MNSIIARRIARAMLGRKVTIPAGTGTIGSLSQWVASKAARKGVVMGGSEGLDHSIVAVTPQGTPLAFACWGSE